MSCWGDEHDVECQRKTAAGEKTVHWYGIFQFEKWWDDSDVARHVFIATEDPPPSDGLATIKVAEYGLAIPWNFDYDGVLDGEGVVDIEPTPPEQFPAGFDEYGFWMNFGGGPGYGFPASKRCPKCGVPILWHAKLCDACKVTMAPCPATHEKGSSHCVLCKTTPGFVEELK